MLSLFVSVSNPGPTNIFTGKWNLCLQIINYEAHPKCELPGMPPKFLIVSVNTNLLLVAPKISTQERRWTNASDQVESHREDNIAGVKPNHRGCRLMDQRAESIYQPVLFGLNSVSVFLSWETAHKIKVLDAVKKLEGLEAGHKRKLSISLLFCGTRTLQSTAHSHSSYLPRLPFPNLPDPWRNLSFQPWAEANWRLSKAFLNRVILGSAWKHPHSQEMSSVDTALTWAALWSSAATDVLGPNTD